MWPVAADRTLPGLGERFGPGAAEVLTRLVASLLRDGVAIQDETGAVLYCDEKAADLLRMRPESLLGRSSFDGSWDSVTLDGDPCPGERHPSMRALASGEASQDEIMGVRCGDGELRWLSIDASPVDLPTGRVVITVFNDVTAALDGHRQLAQTRREIRSQLVQRDLPSTRRFRLAARHRAVGPSRSIGGDFFGADSIDDEDVGFFLGDVCGHGVSSAGLGSTARNSVRALAPVLDDPADVVCRLHEVVQAERPDSFLTLVYGRVAATPIGKVTVRLCCAGHPHPILVRDGRARPVGETGSLVGMVPNSRRPVATLDLLRGDRLLMFSDGVLDDAVPRRSAPELAHQLPAAAPLDEILDWMMDVAADRPRFDVEHADDAAVLGIEVR